MDRLTSGVGFPHKRENVVAAVRALSDVEYQRPRWGRFEEGIQFYDDLALDIHVLYDDNDVLPDPRRAVPAVLHQSEVGPLTRLGAVLAPLLDAYGDSAEEVYLRDPRWPDVVAAAGAALAAMERADTAG